MIPVNRFKYHSVLLESALLLRSHHDLLGSHESLLLPDPLQDDAGLVVQVLVEAVLLDLFEREGSEEGVFLDDLPGVEVQLRVDGSLRLVEDIEAEVVRLNGERST